MSRTVSLTKFLRCLRLGSNCDVRAPGYTSATFSGRCAMPLLADSIVETGRRTLTRAIRLANEWGNQRNGTWRGARVIYGDTDSVFVKLPGRSVKEAFHFGEEFCAAVTASNPPPVQLKLEKVYLGSIMRTVRYIVEAPRSSGTRLVPQ
jgi:DNA polymerase zeta